MAKGKKKKDKKADKPTKSGSGLKALAGNPLMGEVVAAALVATAAALKDSKRARALASDAGDELRKLSKAGSETGSALWEMALAIGKRSLEAITAEPKATKAKGAPEAAKPKGPSKSVKAKAKATAAKAKPAAKKAAPAKRATRAPAS